MNVHICLISDQLMANYLPIKQQKPDAALLISTRYTENKKLTERFEHLLDDLSIAHQRARHLAPEDDLDKLNEYFLELSEQLKQTYNEGTTFTLNITGGTKLMSIAAYNMLEKECGQIIYTNTAAGKIEHIKTRSAVELTGQLNIDEYLKIYGVAPKSYNNQNEEWVATVNARKPLTKQLVGHFSQDKRLLGTFNKLANDAIDRKSPQSYAKELKHPKQQLSLSVNAKQEELLNACQQYGLIDFDKEKAYIYFKSLDAAQYLSGFWLEEYAYVIAKEAGVEEVRCGQAIQWDKKTRNELDLVLAHNNRLLIIECKTCRYRDEKDNDTLYKLDSVAEDLQGLYGAKWLLTVNEIRPEAVSRAKSLRIKPISAGEVKTLKHSIQHWMQGGE